MQRIYRFIHIAAVLALLLAVLPASAPIVQAQVEAPLSVEKSVTLLADIYPGAQSSMPRGWHNTVATRLGNNVVFFAASPQYGLEPWITNGTPVGTKLIKDTFPGSTGVYETTTDNTVDPVTWQGKAFFVGQGRAEDGSLFRQLWVTNGTAAGTKALVQSELRVTKFVAGTNGVVFKVVGAQWPWRDGGDSAWWTDGTSEGTRKLYESNHSQTVMDVYPMGNYGYVLTPDYVLLKVDSAQPQNILSMAGGVMSIIGEANGLLFFIRKTVANGQELWQTDGTISGTVIVADMSPGTLSTEFINSIKYGSKLAFSAKVNTGNGTLIGIYTTTGNSGGITLWGSSIEGNIGLEGQQNGYLFYSRIATNGMPEHWYGTGPMDTKLLCPSCVSYIGDGMGGLPGEIIFTAGDGSGAELWYSDFTDAGTRRITDIWDEWWTGSPDNFISMDGWVFFVAQSNENGGEPYVYRPVSSPIVTVPDKFTAMRGASLPIDVLKNDTHQNGLPLMLAGFDERGTTDGSVSRDDRGTPNDRTDDRLIFIPYEGQYQSDVDGVHYWVEDAAGNRRTGRVSITVVPLGPLPPEDIRFSASVVVNENTLPRTEIGYVYAVDPSPTDYLSHTCVINTTGSPFKIASDGYHIYTDARLDYETHPRGYVINITCTDPTNLSITKDIVIPVVNVNETPELTVPAGLTMAEDAPQQELGQISWSDPENNTNSVRPTAVFGSASLTGCAGGACTLLYQPAANFFGVDTITVKATDLGGLSTEKTITVTVTAGNDDPPVMNPLGTIVRNSGFETHQIGLYGIAAGPYETGPVTIAVSTDNTAMLADLAVDYTEGPEGILTFILHPEEGSEALVTITLSDGLNETEYTFNVIVTDNPPLYLPVIGR